MLPLHIATFVAELVHLSEKWLRLTVRSVNVRSPLRTCTFLLLWNVGILSANLALTITCQKVEESTQFVLDADPTLEDYSMTFVQIRL